MRWTPFRGRGVGGVNVPIGHGICQGDVIVEVGVVVLSPFLQRAKMSPKHMDIWVHNPGLKPGATISYVPTGLVVSIFSVSVGETGLPIYPSPF